MSRSRRSILLETALQQTTDARRRRCRQRRPVGFAVEDGRDRIGDRLAREAIRPVSISYSTQPNAQMSVRLSTACPRACSGLM